MTVTFDRHIRLDGAFNVRDLGGYSHAGGGTTRWRSILRADGLHGLSAADIGYLLELGLETVIDLRSEIELERQPSPFRRHPRVAYHHVPLFAELAPVDMVARTAGSFDLAARYVDAAGKCRAALASVLSVIAEAENDGLMLFNCTAGKDRTGLVAAMLLSLAGVDHEQIAADYALTQTIAEPLLERLRQQALDRQHDPEVAAQLLSCEPTTILTLLTHVDEEYGGFESYLLDHSVERIDLDRVIGRLV